jgi:hypothetical protein
MLGVFVEFETNLRRERQLEGIAKAKAAGAYKGRPPSIEAARGRELKAGACGRSTSPRRSRSAGRQSIGCSARRPVDNPLRSQRRNRSPNFGEVPTVPVIGWACCGRLGSVSVKLLRPNP